jgi:plastocyanin
MRSRCRSRGWLALAGVCLAAAVAVPPAGTAAPANQERLTRVTVKMVEYRFLLSVKKVRTGTVVFTVINRGQLAHIFAIPRLHKITPLLQPGRRYTLRVRFRNPGRFDYNCPVGAHIQYGMAGRLRVIA